MAVWHTAVLIVTWISIPLITVASDYSSDDPGDVPSDRLAHMCRTEYYNFLSPSGILKHQYSGSIEFNYTDTFALPKAPSGNSITSFNSITCRCNIRATRRNDSFSQKPFDVLVRWSEFKINDVCKETKCQDMFKVVLQPSHRNQQVRSHIVDDWASENHLMAEEIFQKDVDTLQLEYVHFMDAKSALLRSTVQVIGSRRMYASCGPVMGGPALSTTSELPDILNTRYDNQASEKQDDHLTEIVIVVSVASCVFIIGLVSAFTVWKCKRKRFTYYGQWQCEKYPGTPSLPLDTNANSLEVQVGTMEPRPPPAFPKPTIRDDFTISFDAPEEGTQRLAGVHSQPPSLVNAPTSPVYPQWASDAEHPPTLPPRRTSSRTNSPYLPPPPPSPRRLKHRSWQEYHQPSGSDSDVDLATRTRLLRHKRATVDYGCEGRRSLLQRRPLPLVSNDIKLPRRVKTCQPRRVKPQDNGMCSESGCESGSESDSSSSDHDEPLSDRFPSSEHHMSSCDDGNDVGASDSISNQPSSPRFNRVHEECQTSRHSGQTSRHSPSLTRTDEYHSLWADQ